MKKTHPILFILLIISSSCQSLYQSGYVTAEYHPLETPMNTQDSTITAHYIRGGIQQGMEYYKGERNEIQFGGYHYAISNKSFNFAAGFNIFHGNYTVKAFSGKEAYRNQAYDYWGGELMIKANINIPISNVVHWRVIGLQLSWNTERGEYYDFRESLLNLDTDKEDSIIEMEDVFNFSMYLNSEILFNPVDKLYLGFNTALGMNMKHANICFVSGAKIEYYKLGLFCNIRESTIPLANATLSIFDNTVSDRNIFYQFGMYYQF